jgi:Orsellinic acid/F9775 biosynthesis cluster protein D/Fungal specific transcription factor domain
MSSTESPPLHITHPAELLEYLSAYKVIVCLSCRYAIQPDAISRHLKDIHNIHRARRWPFMLYVSKFHLEKPQSVVQSMILSFPVPLLPVQDGLRCECGGCSHLCVSVKRMRSHWISAHGRHGQPIIDWNPVPLQTFFRGNLLRYFTKSASNMPCTNEASHPKYIDGTNKIDEKILAHNKFVCDMDTEELSGADIQNDQMLLPSVNELYRHAILDESDAALLNHYTSSTSMTLATDTKSRKLWQLTMPKLAYQHHFLMHGILACSALHLAYQNPAQQREYVIKASIHQARAMPLFRSAIANVTHDNCHAVLVYSHLLVIYSFASEEQDERLLLVEPTGTDVLPNWLYFLRSGCSLLCTVWHELESGPVKALSLAWETPINVSEDFESEKRDYFLSVLFTPSSCAAWPEETCRILHAAAIELGSAFSCTRALGETFTTWDALRVWPMRISVDYMYLLNKWHPGALILLAHYCILLLKVEQHWYFEGRAKRLLETIMSRLDPVWHDSIKWPMKEIGMMTEMA